MADSVEAQSALRRSLAPSLGQIGAPLEWIAEEVVGEDDGVIDWVAAGPDGRAFVVLVANAPGNATFLEEGLVQRAWVRTRIADWRKLAPGLALRADLAPRLLLIASDFARSTRIAAREAADAAGEIWLARWSRAAETGSIEIARVDVAPAAAIRDAEPSPVRRTTSVFRSGLHEADFATGGAT
jgi:hypothetical protein